MMTNIPEAEVCHSEEVEIFLLMKKQSQKAQRYQKKRLQTEGT